MTLRTCCVLFALGLLAAAPARPNVLVIVADDHAAYVAGCYGNSAVHTPNIDRLAAQGTLFTRAYCNAPVCTASRQSFLTGKLPHSVGVTLLPTRLGDDQTTLAEHLKRAGYETAALGKMHFNGPSRHGFDERIDLPEFRRQQRAHPPRAVPSDTAVLPAWKPFADPARIWLNGSYLPYGAFDEDMAGAFFARQAVEFLSRPRDKPFFLVVSFYEPHSPFHFPIEYAGRHDPDRFGVPAVGPEDDDQIPAIFRDLTDAEKQRITASYYTSVEFLDSNIGRVLDGLRRRGGDRDTLVVYLGDHGYMLGQHGRFEKHCSYEPAVRAPLIVRHPGGDGSGKRVDKLVEFIDIFPTVAECCGVPPGDDVQGQSLWPLVRDDSAPGRSFVFSEYLENEEAMIRDDRWKLVYSTGRRARQDGYATGRPLPQPTVRLFDEERDPDELTNLATKPQHAARVARMLGWMADRMRSTMRHPERVPQTDNVHEVLAYCLEPRDTPPPTSK